MDFKTKKILNGFLKKFLIIVDLKIDFQLLDQVSTLFRVNSLILNPYLVISLFLRPYIQDPETRPCSPSSVSRSNLDLSLDLRFGIIYIF